MGGDAGREGKGAISSTPTAAAAQKDLICKDESTNFLGGGGEGGLSTQFLFTGGKVTIRQGKDCIVERRKKV